MTKQEFIDRLFKYPCQDALDDFDTFSKDYDVSVPFEKILTDFFLEHPSGGKYFWWCWGNRLPEQFKTEELINRCSLRDPLTALKYHYNLLTDETFKECALKAPWLVLEYCSQRLRDLDDKLFEKITLKAPWYALKYCSEHLSDELFKESSLMEPKVALYHCSQRCDRFGEEFKEELRKKI